ncbi:AMP-binding protein [Actinoplanes subtropicus]|uniref:AMP-binding protein n=1 Tax=Actinoplanes subtropicus TaxID=543632 RepID=UPI0004C44650|nr:AMP-binding protein [Actinoplanes subtropicus]
MRADDVTFFAGVPTMYRGLLGALDETVGVAALAANLRMAVAGGPALPGELDKQFLERFGVTILEGYGLSETSPFASFSRYGEQPRVGSVGVPIPGVQMRLVEED